MGKGFHIREKGILSMEMTLEGYFVGNCVKPREKGENEGKRDIIKYVVENEMK